MGQKTAMHKVHWMYIADRTVAHDNACSVQSAEGNGIPGITFMARCLDRAHCLSCRSRSI